MNPITVDVFISSISAIVAIISAAIAFYMYKMSKSTLERYDAEIEFLRRQSRSHVFLEIQNSLDKINDKIVDWDLDLTDYDQHLTQRDKKIIVWILHNINFCIYVANHEDLIDSEYIKALRRRCVYGAQKLISDNPKARSWLLSLKSYEQTGETPNHFEEAFVELMREIVHEDQD